MDQLFELSSLLVMPFWLLMILLPTWSWTRRIIGSPLIAALPALLYAALVLPRVGPLFALVSGPELATLAAFMAIS